MGLSIHFRNINMPETNLHKRIEELEFENHILRIENKRQLLYSGFKFACNSKYDCNFVPLSILMTKNMT
jgi:hypothetical protein